MGPVWVSEEAETIRVLGQDINLILANVGNPHGVLLVDDLIDAPVEQIGAALQVHSRFPEGLNVEFVRIDHAEAAVRVYERGVGETLACGSGACAVAVVLRAHTGRLWPIRVRMTGGVLEVTGDESDGVWLTGPVSEDALDEHSRRCLQDLLEA
jgi:diaminopimelate epimerase